MILPVTQCDNICAYNDYCRYGIQHNDEYYLSSNQHDPLEQHYFNIVHKIMSIGDDCSCIIILKNHLANQKNYLQHRNTVCIRIE